MSIYFGKTKVVGNGVQKIIAGDNVTLEPSSGEGIVKINCTGTGGGITLNDIYPVGSVYITMNADIPVAFRVGMTWEKLTEGRCLWNAPNAQLGADIAGVVPDPELSATCENSGSHTHSINDPGHTHNTWVQQDTNIGSANNTIGGATEATGAIKTATTGITINEASGHTHNVSLAVGSSKYTGSIVRPESIGVSMWKRTA